MKKLFLTILLLLLIISVFGQTATSVQVIDKRFDNEPPTYYNKQVVFEFKRRTIIGVPGTGYYSGLMTIAPWSDNSGNAHHQLNFNEGGIYYRTGQPSGTTWDSWSQILTSNSNIKLDGTYGAEIKRNVYPFKAFWYYSDDGTDYGPAWIHTNTNGTTHPTMFLQTSGNSTHLRVNDAIGLGPMTVTLGSYPQITTNTWISGAQGENSYFNSGGNVGIGLTNPQTKLAVNGEITTKEVIVTMDGWADFVFNEDYRLMSLTDLKEYVKTHNHLPGVPTTKEVSEEGISLGEMNKILLQKIEELTLYIMEQDERIKKMERQHNKKK